MADIINQKREFLMKERLYTTIFSQCYSPCGKFLVACNNFGKISIFSLTSALGAEATEDSYFPFYTFQAQDGPLYCISSSEHFLISAGNGNIKGWSWSDVITKAAKVAWTLDVPQSNGVFSCHETNTMVTDSTDGITRLFAGGGDNLVHMWDISTGKNMRSFSGHKDYIHCITIRSNGQQFLSASEDGTVRLWDSRDGKKSVQMIEPSKHEECLRPNLGKWIRTVAIDNGDDWMVCGGGPRLCLWHLRSMSPTTVFDTPNIVVNHAMFHDDSIISAGSVPSVQHWSINGERRSDVPCSPTNVFNLAVNEKSTNLKVLSVVGNSNKIDVCTNFGYKAFSLSFS